MRKSMRVSGITGAVLAALMLLSGTALANPVTIPPVTPPPDTGVLPEPPVEAPEPPVVLPEPSVEAPEPPVVLPDPPSAQPVTQVRGEVLERAALPLTGGDVFGISAIGLALLALGGLALRRRPTEPVA